MLRVRVRVMDLGRVQVKVIGVGLGLRPYLFPTRKILPISVEHS